MLTETSQFGTETAPRSGQCHHGPNPESTSRFEITVQWWVDRQEAPQNPPSDAPTT